ncbi:MAG: hypothetical protein VB051_01300 [Candidatus Pelethousia sp.]|nr:hypothetical protein [Candidatus Pelethousia sp.]
MKKIILIFSFIFLVIFIILIIGQSSFFLHSNIEDNSSDAVKQREEMQPPQNKGEHASPVDTLSDKAESGNELERDLKIDTGTYQGQIDSSFIEIAISGVPEEKATKVFMLSEELKDKFGDMQPNTGKIIKFQYYIDEDKRNVIVEIENQDGER